jgi:hypothetical protein
VPEVLDLGVVSCLEESIDSREDLVVPADAHVVPEVLRELLGDELFGSEGTAYTVCFETGAGGAPVGRLGLVMEDEPVDANGPEGLKDFDFWILPIRPLSPCFLFRKR